MHRLGAILMIVGANVIVASIAAAFWRASFECAVQTGGGSCGAGVMGLFFKIMTSWPGLAYWFAIVVGLLVFWRGKRMRAG